MTFIPLTVLALAIALAGAPPGDDPDSRSSPPSPSDWRFVLPAPGDPFEHTPFRALVLVREKPEDLVEKVAYRGDPSRRRYAQIRFGSAGSIRVTVVLDEVAPGDVDLYVDSDRTRRIDDRDRVAAAPATAAAATGGRRERVWRLPLDVAMVEKDVTRTVPRAVVFRLGASGRTLGYAAAGYLEGSITLGDKGTDPAGTKQPVRRLAVRRADGDGNGLMADPQDRLWIDLNGDGRFDPSAEQFLFATVLNLDGGRYVVRSDELGSRLAVEPLIGVGTLRLAWKGGIAPAPGKEASVELHATALGRDGSVFGLSGTEPATVPVGEYRLGTVTIALDDTRGGQRWSFIFSDNGAKGAPRWYKVAKDGAVSIDPIGTPSFEISLSDNAPPRIIAGADVQTQPLLYNGDGLLITVGYRGSPASPALQEVLGAQISLRTVDSDILATAHSGFA